MQCIDFQIQNTFFLEVKIIIMLIIGEKYKRKTKEKTRQ